MASSEFADSGSFSSNKSSFVEELFVHLFNWEILWTENYQVHMGIDVHMIFTCWFCCAFEKPDTSIDVGFPQVVFSDRFVASDYFVSGSLDRWLEFILVDATFSEPAPGYHPQVVMNLDVELVN